MIKRILAAFRRGKWLLLSIILILSGCGIKKEEPSPAPLPKESPKVTESPAPLQENSNSGQAGATTQIYDQIPERTQNLEIAIREIDGLILTPGQIFSFNETVGDRTEDKGYQEAIGYDEKGEKKPTIGGGICQVSSTIYMAALNGNFEIIERHSHSHEVPYADSDHDATVSYGGYDFKFKNNRDKPVKLSVKTDGKSVTAKMEETEK